MALLAALSVLGGCGSAASSGRPCTEIAAAVGLALDIRPPLAAKVADATMKVCVDGACRTPEIHLAPTTKAGKQTCSGNDPDDTCGVSVVRTGGKYGFAPVPGLTKRPARVSVVLRDGSGKRLLDQRIVVTPKAVFPNGPHCGEGGPQAGVIVENGRLRERP